MAYEQKEGDIAVFLEKNKKSENGPDWTGRALIGGIEKDVSLWVKSDTMLAGQIKPKWVPDMDKARDAVEKADPIPEDPDDSIPF